MNFAQFLRDVALGLYTLSTYIGESIYCIHTLCIHTLCICMKECTVETVDL